MVERETKLLTVKQFVESCKGGWPASEGAVRALILDAAWGKNKFQSAFLRVGRRVLICEKEFWKAVEEMQEGRKNACK